MLCDHSISLHTNKKVTQSGLWDELNFQDVQLPDSLERLLF
jgi:hypothetical protein